MHVELSEFGVEAETSSEPQWIASTVAIVATVVFVVSGMQVLPAALGLTDGEQPVHAGMATVFILNIALVLFAWRRSVQLRHSFAERDKARRQATTLAYVDDVTGLPNRRYFNERMARLCEADKLPVALLLLDVDHFKQINDLHGHEVGDEVLIEVASRIRALCPPHAFCVRLGGDEFALALTGAAMGQAEELAERLVQRLASPVELPATTARIGASIGLSRSEGGLPGPSALLRRADLAMYEAKRLGRGRWAGFDDRMERELSRRTLRESELRTAIAEDQFEPYFQPIIGLDSGAVSGFEVLARWRHPVRGVLEPHEFMDTAEQTGLLAELSFRVMERALQVAGGWPSHYKIAVNVSAVQFKDPLLAQRILQLLAKVGFPAARLELEIAERCLVANRELALTTIQSLRSVGVTVAIDDFGAGYSAHTQLRSLPFDRIKIDRGFVASLLDDQQSDAIVKSIVTLGKGLNIPITAGGVESENISAKLRALGCIDAQGWLFAKPLSAEEAGQSIRGLDGSEGDDVAAAG